MRSRTLTASFFFAIIVSGCGAPKCPYIAQDQSESFLPAISGGRLPILLGVDTHFSAAQEKAIQEAAAQWNALGNRLIGKDFFQVAEAAPTLAAREVDPKKCGSWNTGGGIPMIRGTREDWATLGLSSGVHGDGVPGVTYRCYGSGYVTDQVTFLNPQWVAPAQFKSIAIHELGHTLGLQHSCDEENHGNPNFRDCKTVTEGDPYQLAVMYFQLHAVMPQTGGPETKETLTGNDISRTQCIY